MGFWYASFDTEGTVRGVRGSDTLAVGTIPAIKAYMASGMSMREL